MKVMPCCPLIELHYSIHYRETPKNTMVICVSGDFLLLLSHASMGFCKDVGPMLQLMPLT
ncbi:hypothetical protein U9M48_030570 [Paspalum notatum var. saurae]|uniref:Uncharacterized protein n=1 Tax=Paspalum notatum var. saurae TaxID=547442 RepID=A0AAQ3U3V0_PASNO